MKKIPIIEADGTKKGCKVKKKSELEEAYKYCSDEDLLDMRYNANKKERIRISKELKRRKSTYSSWSD